MTRKPLRVVTYLVPSIPVELFETIAHYLEAALGRDVLLSYESRFSGPSSDRVDIFKEDVADLAFVSGSSYQDLAKENNENWELLPVGAVFPHFARGETAGYYADIIIHQSAKDRIKEFLDLRGSNWATNSPSSTSGHFVVLKLLREQGENPSFFGSVLNSGSHMNSVQMVVSRKADVAAVDSNALAYTLAKNPNFKKEIHVLTSIGPLPPYPIMVRSSVSLEEKKAISNALIQLPTVDPWNQRVSALGLSRFVKITKDVFLAERETRDSLANVSASVRYY